MSFNTILRATKEDISLSGEDLIKKILLDNSFTHRVLDDNTVDYYTFDGGLIQLRHENLKYITGHPRYYSDPNDLDSYVDISVSRNVPLSIAEPDSRLEDALLTDATNLLSCL